MRFYGCLHEPPHSVPLVGQAYLRANLVASPRPDHIMLRSGPVFEQFGEHCVATAMLDGFRTLELESKPEQSIGDTPLGSRRWAHWVSFVDYGQAMGLAGGRRPSDAIRTLRAKGLPLENFWEYGGTDFDGPPPDALKHAYDQRHEAEVRSVPSSNDLLAALALHKPGLLVVAADQDLDDYHKGVWSGGGPTLGYHMMLVVGYEDDIAICKNSWGSSYGYQGFVFIPLKTLDNPEVVTETMVIDQGPTFSERDG